MITGIILGLIALPLSLWLSLHFNIGGVRISLGVVGSIILLFHQLPFILIGHLDKLNYYSGFVFWTIVYGSIGLMFDFKRLKKTSNN